MKSILSLVCVIFVFYMHAYAQPSVDKKLAGDLEALIAKYSDAREKKDTILLKQILAPGIDQLVSSGEWRNGIRESVKGMLNSSAANPGTRTLKIEKLRMLNPTAAIIDCRYEIGNNDGSRRNMWSTFIAVLTGETLKITAIRNMLPSPQ